MNKHELIKLVGLVSFFILFINSTFGAVEVFSKYNTHLTINNDNTIEVNKSLSLKNVYDVGIVPGQIEFKIGKGTEGSIANIDVIDVMAVDRFGTEIKSQIRQTKDFSVIILDIYYPLLPGFEYNFDLYYKLSYKPGGIFFKSLQIPLRESTIPIESGIFTVTLPENYHFTYIFTEDEKADINGNTATWTIKDNNPKSVAFEYSYIPLSISGFKGSYVFWILINLALVLFLVYEVRREIKRIRAEEQVQEG
jgi:hypothetical protein